MLAEAGRRHFFLSGALALVALLIVIGGARAAFSLAAASERDRPGAGAQRATAVQAVAATPRTFTDNIEAIGQAKALQAVSISSNTLELVSNVRMKDGLFVGKGQVLVELKAREQQADLTQAKAAQQVAALNYTRYKILADKGFFAPAALDGYKAALDEAKAGVAAAESREQDRVIRAPFSGRIGMTDLAPGAVINAGTVIATLDDVSTMRVDFDVPDRFLPALKIGAPLTAQPDPYPGKVVTGHLKTIDSRIDPTTHAIRARAEFPNPNNLLVPGMLMHVAIQSSARIALGLPESAVQSDSDQSYVYVIAQQGNRAKAVRTAVTIGADQNGYVEITNGLTADQTVVANGLDRVAPDGPVRVLAAGQTDAAQPRAANGGAHKKHS